MLFAPLLLPARFVLQEQLAAGMLFLPCRLHGSVRMSSCLRFWNQWACRVARPRKNFWRGGWMPDTQWASVESNSFSMKPYACAHQRSRSSMACLTLTAKSISSLIYLPPLQGLPAGLHPLRDQRLTD